MGIESELDCIYSQRQQEQAAERQRHEARRQAVDWYIRSLDPDLQKEFNRHADVLAHLTTEGHARDMLADAWQGDFEKVDLFLLSYFPRGVHTLERLVDAIETLAGNLAQHNSVRARPPQTSQTSRRKKDLAYTEDTFRTEYPRAYTQAQQDCGDRRPTQERVGEKLGITDRHLRTHLTRYGLPWPPEPPREEAEL